MAVEEDGHRAVVYQFHLHVGAEPAGLHRHSFFGELFGEEAIEGLCLFRRCGPVEGGPLPFATVAVKGEVGDEEHFAFDVPNREVKPPGFVFEDAKPGDLSGEIACVFFRVVLGDPDEDEEPGADLGDGLPFNAHLGLFYPLHNRPHGPHLNQGKRPFKEENVKRIYVGTCGQVMGLKKLLETYTALEINATFYRFPTEKQRKNWARVLAERKDFFLSLKAYQGFTHPAHSPTWKKAGLNPEERERLKDFVGCLRWNEVTEGFLDETARLIEELKADFLLFQLPSYCQKEEENAFSFFEKVSAALEVKLGFEIRWPSVDLLAEVWRRYGVIPVFDPFLEPELRETFFPQLDFLYLRLHGRRDERGRLDYKHRYSDEELRELRAFIEGARAETVCVLFNNVYMKEDARRFLEMCAEGMEEGSQEGK